MRELPDNHRRLQTTFKVKMGTYFDFPSSYQLVLSGLTLIVSKAPKTLEQIANHDQKVIENWKQLCKEEKTTDRKPVPEAYFHPLTVGFRCRCLILGGPALNLYKEYIKSNRENLLKYAFGKGQTIGDDQSQSKTLLGDSYSLHESLLSVSTR